MDLKDPFAHSSIARLVLLLATWSPQPSSTRRPLAQNEEISVVASVPELKVVEASSSKKMKTV